jgi:hypothetical protein
MGKRLIARAKREGGKLESVSQGREQHVAEAEHVASMEEGKNDGWHNKGIFREAKLNCAR